jgi:Zn-dependent peptidase ImmA (M78 family)
VVILRIDKIEIEGKALKIRQENNIQTYGIKDIFGLIEQKGIHLIRYPFGKDKLLGFATVFEGKKVIVSNSSEILSREIFTIAHELGHIVYDFEDNKQDIKIDIDDKNGNESISEKRAFYFADCLLMPEEQLKRFIKYELLKEGESLNAIDIIRLQIEFQVSFAAAVQRLLRLNIINYNNKGKLFDIRDNITSKVLFQMANANERLLSPTDAVKVPPKYLEYVISNYENDYIPYSSLEKALSLFGMDASIFKKDGETEIEPDLDNLFEEYE